MSFDNRGASFDLTDALAKVAYKFIECVHLRFCGFVAVQVTDEADSKGDIVEVIARDVSAIDLAGPAVPDLDLPIARGFAVANDKVVGEAILHFSNTSMVIVKDASVSLSGAAVVNDDVFPATAFYLGFIDCTANRWSQVAPTLEGPEIESLFWRFVAGVILQA